MEMAQDFAAVYFFAYAHQLETALKPPIHVSQATDKI